MAEAGKVASGLGLPGEVSQWPLKRYGRFMLLHTGESPDPGSEADVGSSPTWKVFESSEETGPLVLTIVVSGHFFISQGQTLLEGFSLIGSKSWLKIVRREDCLLFGTTIKPYLNREQQMCVAAGTGILEGRTSVMHLAQTILTSEKLPLAYEQSSWGAEELGPFLRLCLMDQNFPAFVEEVEKELKKITQS